MRAAVAEPSPSGPGVRANSNRLETINNNNRCSLHGSGRSVLVVVEELNHLLIPFNFCKMNSFPSTESVVPLLLLLILHLLLGCQIRYQGK